MEKGTLFSGESKNVEYKVAVPDKSDKYMKTVVTFTNGQGGQIVFGVDDKTLEVAIELGWTVGRVKYDLNKLKKKQIIKRVGSSHNGHWELLIDKGDIQQFSQ